MKKSFLLALVIKPSSFNIYASREKIEPHRAKSAQRSNPKAVKLHHKKEKHYAVEIATEKTPSFLLDVGNLAYLLPYQFSSLLNRKKVAWWRWGQILTDAITRRVWRVPLDQRRNT